MASSFVTPRRERLTLANGNSLFVRRRLTVGEQTDSYDASSKVQRTADGGVETLPQPLLIGYAKVAAYLLDWDLSRTDDDAPSLQELDLRQRIEVLRNLEPDVFFEMRDLIDAHERAQDAQRAAEKNGQGGESNAPAISPSPFAAAGASSGSVS